MSLGLAINLTAPDTEATRLLLQDLMLAATLLVVALLGWPLLVDAFIEFRGRRVTMELLFVIGVAAAMAISVQSMLLGTGPVYFEVVSILLVIYSIGRAINQHSRQRAASVMQSLTSDIRVARVARPGMPEQLIDISGIRRGDLVSVMPGELIPVDGRVVRGTSSIRQTTFTGEWAPRVASTGETVLAGAACEDGSLLIEATSEGAARGIDRLADLIDAARRSPTSMQRQADQLVGWFLPIVLAVAGGALVFWSVRQNWQTGLFNALAVMLVACPCAAGLATPLAISSALTRLARRGLIVGGGDGIERFAEVDGVIFDKTGTLSDEQMVVRRIDTSTDPAQREHVYRIIAAVERRSAHPVAKALAGLARNADVEGIEILSLQTVPGRGVEARIAASAAGEQIVRIARNDEASPGELRLTVTIDEQWAAAISLGESLRQTAGQSIEMIRKMGLAVRVMTGDLDAAASDVSRLAPTTAAMTPTQKHEAVLALRGESQLRRPLFVGDGINDAAAMAASHASIALADGAQIAVESASATLHGGDLTLVPEAIGLARQTVASIRSSLRFAVCYNAVGIAAAAGGWLHPVLASILMACSSAWVSWRSLRSVETLDLHPSTDPFPEHRARTNALPRPVLHVVGIFGQLAILIPLAKLSIAGSMLILAVAAVLSWLTARYAPRLPLWSDHLLGMMTIGGLGMNLGWWADLGFGPAVHGNVMRSCCSPTMGHSSHWMYIGMILLGTPAMYLLARERVAFSWRRWCCIGPLVVGVPGMCLGMFAGAIAAERVGFASPVLQIFVAYALMMLGMLVGMLLPHAFHRADAPYNVPG